MHTRGRATAVVVAALSLVGCVDELDPDVGGRALSACDPRDSNPSVEVSFTRDVQPLILRERAKGGCSCHMAQASSHVGYDITRFDLTSLETLRRGGSHSTEDIVVEGDPCSSVLYLKTGYAPPFGSRMPLSGPPFWSDEERLLLHDWIAEGARDN